MENKEFKVWCKNKQEWEKNICFINEKGQLLHETKNGLIILKPDTHIAVFYTGLKDKKTKKIYEQDILKDNIGRLYLVYFEKGRVVQELIQDQNFGGVTVDKSGKKTSLAFAYNSKKYKKIGSKFEKPNLLE